MSSDPMARVTELEAENEELYAQLEAAERGSTDVSALREKNERLRAEVAKAREEVAELRARRLAIEGTQTKNTGIGMGILAFLVGVAIGAGIFHGR